MSDSIKVAVRVRPFNRPEMEDAEGDAHKDQKLTPIVEVSEREVTLHKPEWIDGSEEEPKNFAFHRCYWSTDDSLGAPPVDN